VVNFSEVYKHRWIWIYLHRDLLPHFTSVIELVLRVRLQESIYGSRMFSASGCGSVLRVLAVL